LGVSLYAAGHALRRALISRSPPQCLHRSPAVAHGVSALLSWVWSHVHFLLGLHKCQLGAYQPAHSGFVHGLAVLDARIVQQSSRSTFAVAHLWVPPSRVAARVAHK
jgi:hypothetical protein